MSINAIGTAILALGLPWFLASHTLAQSEPAKPPPVLAFYDWSVNPAHSLALKPPPLEVVQAFTNAIFRTDYTKVCDFVFADLHNSGTLSLIVSIDGGGTGGCNSMDIVDKTSSGFVIYSSWAFFLGKDDVRDINGDGKRELVLWALMPIPEQNERCLSPLIFAWSGTGYKEVSSQYKRYYQQYLKDLNEQMGIGSSSAESKQKSEGDKMPESQPTMVQLPQQTGFSGVFSDRPSVSLHAEAPFTPQPAEVPSPATTPEPDDPCWRVNAAKTEAFLGVRSDATMNYAIKASESKDPDDRKLAAFMFSHIKAPEAMADLKKLAADSDPEVAEVAKDRLSAGSEPVDYYRQLNEGEPIARPTPTDHDHRHLANEAAAQ